MVEVAGGGGKSCQFEAGRDQTGVRQGGGGEAELLCDPRAAPRVCCCGVVQVGEGGGWWPTGRTYVSRVRCRALGLADSEAAAQGSGALLALWLVRGLAFRSWQHRCGQSRRRAVFQWVSGN